MLGSCVHHLSEGGDVKVSRVNQKKKARILDDGNIKEGRSILGGVGKGNLVISFGW